MVMTPPTEDRPMATQDDVRSGMMRVFREGQIEKLKRVGPSVGDPGYLPYCCACPTMARMVRTETEFVCRFCGNHGRRINGEDMFEQTAPLTEEEEAAFQARAHLPTTEDDNG